jgi:MarR family transcriptional regulator, lower aerobic nicotinate degradation pathway regulator
MGFVLAQSHMAAREVADRALAEEGLTMKAYGALATLISDGPISQQRLAQRIRMDPATMVDVIDDLEREGGIIRRRNPNDRREYALETTPKGRSLYKRAERAIDRAERRTLRNLDPAEVAELFRLLTRIAAPDPGD